jgi:hypothetical protein
MPDKKDQKPKDDPKPQPLSDDQLDQVAGGKGDDEEGQKK